MNVYANVTDVKNNINEKVEFEEWVKGGDTYIKMFPAGTPPVEIKIQSGALVIEYGHSRITLKEYENARVFG